MRKINILLLAGVVMSLGSCSKDETITGQPEGKSGAPQLAATVEQLPVTRSGVIENNGNYADGEKFYWSNGDATTVLFRNPSMTDATQYKRV